MPYEETMPERLRRRLEQVGALTDEEREAAADEAELDELLRRYFKDEVDNEDLLAALQQFEAAGKWRALRLAHEKLDSSFKRDTHGIAFTDNPDGTITVGKEERVEQPSKEPQKTEGKVMEVTDATFDTMIAGPGEVVVDCWAAWCGPCRMVAPVIEELAKDYAGKATFAKLDVDKNPATARKFGIQSIPTILFFKGGKLVDQKIGAMPKAMLEPTVKKHLA